MRDLSLSLPRCAAAALTVLVLTGAACKPAMIPGTSVEDSDENRRVIEFLGKYRDAVVERSPDAVAGLCTRDYFEDNGTVDQKDDYGIDGLKGKLKLHFEKMKEVHLEIVVQQIERPEGDKGPVRVAFRYNQRALVAFPAGEKWLTLTDVNRLVLHPDDAAGFLIQSGL